jgi:Flp pilus assembly protein TadD
MARKKRGSRSFDQTGPPGQAVPSAIAVNPQRKAEPSPGPWSWLLPPLLLLAAGIATYANSFSGSFVFDDDRAIVNAPEVRQGWPFPGAPFPGPRSLVNWSFALNFAVCGLQTWDYHAVNLTVHLLAGLTLYGLVLGTLSLPSLNGRYGSHARWLALAVALIWLVHPLQTESVTYIVQRAEAMVGLFYLLTLLCLLRGAAASWARHLWYAACVLCCALGMLCKEVMCTAPLLALLYDRIFLSSSWASLLRRRGLLYLGLAATFVILTPSLKNAFTSPPAAEEVAKTTAQPGQAPTAPAWEFSAGFGMPGLTWQQYVRSQPQVILQYLRLVFWPDSLCLDYGWPVVPVSRAIVPAMIVGALVLLTVVLLFRRPALGFVGVWFFLTLAPTSSIMPIADLAVEHRVYLALAAPVLLFVLAGDWVVHSIGRRFAFRRSALRWLAGGLLAVVVLSLGWRTMQRNEDYHDPLRMWTVTVQQRPHNSRVHASLGRYLAERGYLEEAERHCRIALELNPTYAEAESNLGICLFRQKRLEEAEYHCRKAVHQSPGWAIGWNNLGVCLVRQQKVVEAEEQFRESLRLNWTAAQTHFNLALCLIVRSLPAEAEEHLRLALRFNPDHPGAHARLAFELASRGNNEEALPHFEATTRLLPDDAQAHYNLGRCLSHLGMIEQARRHFARANQLDTNIRPPDEEQKP